MRSYPRNSADAAARIVALVLISDGHVCSSEFDILKQLGAERELGLEPRLLPHIVYTLCEELLAGGLRDRFAHGQRRRQRLGDIDVRDLGSCAAKDGAASIPGRGTGRWPLGRRRNLGAGGRAAPLETRRWRGTGRREGGPPPRCLIGNDQEPIKAVPQPPPALPMGGAVRAASGWRGFPPSRHRCCPAGEVRAAGRRRLRRAG